MPEAAGAGRPVSVTILAWVYIAVGVMGFAYHFHGLVALESDSIWIEGTECLAIAAGVFLLRAENWARWLALAWIVFHVALSAFLSVREFLVHCVFCGVIGWILFRGAAGRYFRGAQGEQ